MTIRPEQPEPFLRGCVFPAVTDAPYPRADPANADYLPADVWDAAQLPVGVRLELEGNARTIRVWYKTTRASLGYRGEAAGCSFVAYRAGQKVAIQEAVMGEGMAELVMAGRPDLPVTVYLPEGMGPVVTAVAGVEEPISPAPLQPRWLAYGDAVTQGWLASAPAMAWPAVAGRKLGLDVCNLGYAGTARGEMTSALMLAETPAEVISIAFGMNNWSRVPYTTGLISEEVRCFLSVVRQGQPETPIVVVSPTARPDAEETPNRVGATLAELRSALEAAVLGRIDEGDDRLFLVAGLGVVDAEDLEDGIYPGDEGHRRLAAAVSKVLVPHLTDLQTRAEKRWAAEGTPPTPVAVGSPPVAVDRPTAGASAASRPGATGSAADSAPADPDGADVDGTGPSTAPFEFDDLDSGDSHDRRDRRLLDDAMLDALSPEVSLADGATANGAAASGGSREDSAVDGPSRNGSRHDGAEPPVSGNHAVGDAVVGATVETAMLDRGPTEAGPADRALSDTESGSGAGDTEPTDTASVDPAPVAPAPSAPAPVGSAPLEGKKVPPRPTTPVDIEIADMVSAALALATNGVEDVVMEPDPTPTIELQWEQVGSMDDFSMDDGQWAGGEVLDEPQWADPGTVGAAQWTDSGLDDDQLQWEEAAPAEPADEPQWTDAGAHHEQHWVDAGPVDEQQWSDAAPADEPQWSDAAPTDELQWSDTVSTADELQWSETAPADELQWSDPGPTDELQWSELGDAGARDELEWSAAEPGPY